MKYIANCSCGKDSLAMVLRILKEGLRLDEVVFYDTGMEFDSIYRNRDKLKKILESKGILFTELSSKNSFLFDMFIRPVKYRNPEEKPYPMHYGYSWCGGGVYAGELVESLLQFVTTTENYIKMRKLQSMLVSQ